ncbi:MAG: substrate-binding domain-containing protein [Lachnospiraceae bacterium]|nr:substrate-binding domain-containing protein [Lachnospiraceae bacterium]
MLFRKMRLLLVAMLIPVMLCACGKENTSGGNKTDVPGETGTVTPSEEPGKEQTSGAKALPGGKTLTLATLPKVDGALYAEAFYDAAFAEIMGVPAEEAKLFLPCSNTDAAYRKLTEGTADMIFATAPSEEQEKAAKEAGTEFEFHALMNDGFVFFVNAGNPVNSITQDQLKDIVRGKIKNWKEVGGEDEPIVLFQRNPGSDSQNALYHYVLPKDRVQKPLLDKQDDSIGGAIDRFKEYDNGKGAISFTFYRFVSQVPDASNVKLLSIDGIAPAKETIAEGKYPFVTPVQIVTRKDLPSDSIVRDIIAWLQGENGVRIARENGYIPCESK